MFANGASVNGTLNGGAGVDTINYSAYTTSVTVNLALGTATGTSGISNIENIIGGAGNDLLTGDGGNNVITGNGGNDTMSGGAGDDTYIFSDGWGVNDVVVENVGEGHDTLDLSATTGSLMVGFGLGITVTDGVNTVTAAGNNIEMFIGGSGVVVFNFTDATTKTVVLTDLGSSVGFKGTVNGLEFDNVDNLVVGAATDDSLTGMNADATWTLEVGSSTLDVGARSLTFSGFELLNGNSGADNFTFGNGATFNGAIDGKGGDDTLNFDAYTTARSVTLTSVGLADGFNGTTSVITNGFSNINTIVGSSANGDTLTGANLTSSWKFDVGSSTLEVGSNVLNFFSIESLVGGAASDTFTVADGVNFNGAINGAAGNDTLTYANSTTAHTVVLTSVGSTDGFNGNAGGISGGFSNINAIIGNGLDTLNLNQRRCK